jgi:HlyD family secretion protein
MKMPAVKWLPVLAGVTLVAAAIVALRPRGVEVDLGTVDRGPLEVTIREDGKTRIKERYTISAPLAGKLERMPWDVGDPVCKEADVIAVIVPTDPELLDPRARAQAEARVHAAEALQSKTAAQLDRARVNHAFAGTNLERARKVFATRAASRQDVDNAEQAELTAGHALREAEFAAIVARFELEQARAVLSRADAQEGVPADSRHEIQSPVGGSILRVFEESSTVVAPGAKLVELGDPRDLEIEVDVLSTDAVQVKPGARVSIEHWGGDQPLAGRVRVIEPSAFTKVSALGVEEQRVNVIIDFVSPPAERAALGDGFRIEARIVTWEAPDVLRVPAGALFRDGDAWAVFVVENDRVALRRVNTGRSSDDYAEVIDGLQQGDEVILYPGDLIEAGARVRKRR